MTEFLPREVIESLEGLDLVVQSVTSVPEIPRVLNQTVLCGGKRLRPTLCFLMGKILGLTAGKVAPFARAAEFTHSASLAHDDVVDNATQRRHRQTLNASTSNSRAVLAGDLLLARVMLELSEFGNIDIIHDLAVVVEDLVNGEWLQLEARGRVDVTWDHLLQVTLRKTASLMSWCCTVAVRLAYPADKKLLKSAQNFGQNLGIAFQMVDDVIDFAKQGEKDYAKDLKEGLVNFVVAELLVQNPQLTGEVAKCLNQPTFDSPWTQKEIDQALASVREKSAGYLKVAQTEFNFIKTFSDSSDPGVAECIGAIEMLIEFLKVRQS